ncbi:hypothetical protein PROFUN_16365, partial [Planoprotostelium fungivorum]
ELLEEKEKEYAAEVKRVQVDCTSKTMSLDLQLEEMLKTIEQKDKFITKQMMSLRKYMAHDMTCFTFQVQQAGKRHKQRHKTQGPPTNPHYLLVCSNFYPVCIKHALSTQKLTNVLQRIYKLISGSKHSVCAFARSVLALCSLCGNLYTQITQKTQ